ncbi:hypothetical protein B0H13DRAFT_864746 [Mycena leptocephala]|nr:hypothetical protein B0H13DRAFT_864746 [Mycena leptocephala]
METDSPSSAELIPALGSLALDLMAVGRYDEALHVGEERVELCRRAAATSSTPNQDLAGALDALGSLLHALGRKEEVLLACEEAVKLRRSLQETGTLPVVSLANSLENLGYFLRTLSRHKESLSRAQEAVDLQRRLIATDPDLSSFLVRSPKNVIMGSFAHALENLAFSLSAVGNAEDAVHAAAESVDIYRSLPDRTGGLEAGLACALCSLAAFLRAVDRQKMRCAPIKKQLTSITIWPRQMLNSPPAPSMDQPRSSHYRPPRRCPTRRGTICSPLPNCYADQASSSRSPYQVFAVPCKGFACPWARRGRGAYRCRAG